MSFVVLAIGVVLLSVPALTSRRTLGPAAQVRLACAAVTSGMWILVCGMLFTASPMLFWWHDGDGVSRAGVGHLAPGGPLVWTAGGLIGGFGVSWVLVAVRRASMSRRQAALPRWAADIVLVDEVAGAEVRVAPTLQLMAFAVPGRDRHIVISHAITRLPDVERRAVVAHEGAHLRLRHDRHLLVFATYERIWGWIPGVAQVVARHRGIIERWADLDAASRPSVDVAALQRARSTLAQCSHHGVRDAESTDRSSKRELVGLTAALFGLILAGAYAATHTAGDLGSILAAVY